ncbi:MAG: glutamate 5-kinase [Clostridiales bacterium]|nr:glutamate 5-kinase [Clostridiales bacterium]
MANMRDVRRVVVKVGTSTLTHENGRLNFRRIEKLARTLSDLKNNGLEIILVTSGAVGLGMARLGLEGKPKDIRVKQAAAAVGQSELMNIYSRMFSEYGYKVAQLLLTRDVADTEELRTNVTNTVNTLIDLDIIPIVNENDTVSTFELNHITAFGDNDTLSAVVSELSDADCLVILSDIDGLYDADPREYEEARLIPIVREITEEMKMSAGGSGTSRGTGGMATKLAAAESMMRQGKLMVIASGDRPELLYDLFSGRTVGTLFMPKGVK